MKTVSVVDFGAAPNDPAVDSAPAFRTAIASNRIVNVPPGIYYFKTTVQPRPLVGRKRVGNYAILQFSDLQNVKIDGHGATLVYDPSLNEANQGFKTAVTIMVFQRSNNLEIEGLTLKATRTNLGRPTEVPVGIVFFSVRHLKAHDLTFTGNWSGLGTAFGADWLVDADIYANTMVGVGQCGDFAYLQNVTIRNNNSSGSRLHPDDEGNSGKGLKCWSFIKDVPNLGGNETKLDFNGVTDGDYTNSVLVENNYVASFNNGVWLAAGSGYEISGNTFENNGSDRAGSLSGGLNIVYAKGVFASAGDPPQRIRVLNNQFRTNASSEGGNKHEIIVDSHNSTGETLRGIKISNNRIDRGDPAGVFVFGKKFATDISSQNNIVGGER